MSGILRANGVRIRTNIRRYRPVCPHPGRGVRTSEIEPTPPVPPEVWAAHACIAFTYHLVPDIARNCPEARGLSPVRASVCQIARNERRICNHPTCPPPIHTEIRVPSLDARCLLLACGSGLRCVSLLNAAGRSHLRPFYWGWKRIAVHMAAHPHRLCSLCKSICGFYCLYERRMPPGRRWHGVWLVPWLASDRWINSMHL